MSLEEAIKSQIQPKDAGFIAVESLVKVKNREKSDFGTDIELKTDLEEIDVLVHTVCDEVNRWLSMKNDDDMGKINILSTIVERKERKLLSKGRKSRHEVVEVAKKGESDEIKANKGFLRSLFTPRA